LDQTRQHSFNDPMSEAFLNDRKNDEHECSAFAILPHNGDPIISSIAGAQADRIRTKPRGP